MILSPNDEEVANSSKKNIPNSRLEYTNHTSDQNGRNWYPISNQNGWKTIPFGAAHTHIAYIKDFPPPPRGAKNALQIMSLAAYASETNKANSTFLNSLRKIDVGAHVTLTLKVIACEQALLFGRAKRVSQERVSERRSREGQRNDDLS